MNMIDAHKQQPEAGKPLLFKTTSEGLIMFGYYRPSNDTKNLLGTFTGISINQMLTWGPISTGYHLWDNNKYEVTHWIYIDEILEHLNFPAV